MLVTILILTNLITGIALISYVCESVHYGEMQEQAKRNIRDATDDLNREWQRLDMELATHRRLTREMAAMGGNRISKYMD
jgi:hypothetical protein